MRRGWGAGRGTRREEESKREGVRGRGEERRRLYYAPILACPTLP